MSEIKIHAKYDVLRDPKELLDNPKNPNRHDKSQIDRLAQIYEYQGIRHPIVVSKRSGYIVAGHGRKQAAIKAKINEFPVVYQDFDSDEAEYSFLVSDNGIAMWAELDLSMINFEVPNLGPDFNLAMLGLKDFILEPAEKIPGCDEDSVPDMPKEPKTKRGDIFELGQHRLYCGDSTIITDVEKLMNGEMADFTITSPPYNVGLSYNEYEDNKSESDYTDMLKQILSNIRTICTKDYWLLWNVGVYPLSLHLHLHLLRDYFKIERSIAWIKTGITGPPMIYHMQKKPVVKNYMPNFGWEIIACCHLNKELKGSKKIPDEIMQESMTDVWEISQHSNSKDQGRHPGAFPIKIPERAIQLYCENNVYEPFGGSGSTLIACEKTNRKCFAMEIDPHYCDVIIDRFETYSKKDAYRINEDGTKTKWKEIKINDE